MIEQIAEVMQVEETFVFQLNQSGETILRFSVILFRYQKDHVLKVRSKSLNKGHALGLRTKS